MDMAIFAIYFEDGTNENNKWWKEVLPSDYIRSFMMPIMTESGTQGITEKLLSILFGLT